MAVMYKVAQFHDPKFCSNVQDYEQYALLYSKTVAEDVFSDDDTNVDQYVRLQYGGKVIFRKCAAWRTVKSSEITLGNRTIRELGLQKAHLGVESVQIQKSNWFSYQFNNSDISLKLTFIIGLLGFVCSILSFFLSLLG